MCWEAVNRRFRERMILPKPPRPYPTRDLPKHALADPVGSARRGLGHRRELVLQALRGQTVVVTQFCSGGGSEDVVSADAGGVFDVDLVYGCDEPTVDVEVCVFEWE